MKSEKYFKEHIATIMDFPKPGIQFRDVTPTLEDAEAFSHAIDALYEMASKWEFDKVICADARGFIFGSPLALRSHRGLVIARKPNKLPRPGFKFNYDLEYGSNTLEISQGSIKPGEKVLIVDDLLATGGSAIALINLIKQSKATAVGSVFYIELPDLHGKENIKKAQDIEVLSVVKFEGE